MITYFATMITLLLIGIVGIIIGSIYTDKIKNLNKEEKNNSFKDIERDYVLAQKISFGISGFMVVCMIIATFYQDKFSDSS